MPGHCGRGFAQCSVLMPLDLLRWVDGRGSLFLRSIYGGIGEEGRRVTLRGKEGMDYYWDAKLINLSKKKKLVFYRYMHA